MTFNKRFVNPTTDLTSPAKRHTVYCKSFEVEKFRGFRELTGDRETFPMKDFPTGNF